MSLQVAQVYHQGDDYYRDLALAIKTAQFEILLESYIFDDDEIGKKILNQLAESAKRGVRIWLIVDGIGSYSSLPELSEFCKRHKINLGIYHPSPLTVLRFGQFAFSTVYRVFHFLRRLNNRNHRKTTVVDGRLAFLGSFNISRVHSFQILKEAAWRDSGVQVKGSEIEHLRRAFYLAWKKCRRLANHHHVLFVPPFVNSGQRRLFLNYKFRQRFLMNRILKRSIRQAKERIWITSPYFIPKGSLQRSLKIASRNGVQVVLCLPHNTDVFIVKMASYTLFRRLLLAGVRIFEYEHSNLHAKYKVIDNKIWVGSKNLNHRSLIHDLEVELVDDTTEVVQSFEAQWNQDLQRSREILMTDLDKLPFWKVLLSHILFVFRYWL